MVLIEVTSTVRPEGRERALAAMRTMGEPGCLHYRFYNDVEDPNVFFIYERWTDDAALEAHRNAPHMAEFRKVFPEVLVGAPVFFRYDIDSP
jgi:quinol monooxygenase YgiN